jgi:hypothetical protein
VPDHDLGGVVTSDAYFTVTRRSFRGDSHLPVVNVTIDRSEAA